MESLRFADAAQRRKAMPMKSAQPPLVQPIPSARGKKHDHDGNPTDLAGFYKQHPEFLWGPAALSVVVSVACTQSSAIATKLADGRAVFYGGYDTCVYTIFAILATFAAHGWFCVHAAQERQLQQFERTTRDDAGARLPMPDLGQASMSYIDRKAPRGASVRSTAALLTSFVYAFYPFGAPTTSWAAFVGWTCGLALYWDVHFFIAHKAFHEHPALYKFFHKLHHFYTQPDVFGAYYVTYQSHLVTEQLVILLACFAGLPRDVFTWTMFLGTFDTCVKHSGHSISSVQRGLPISYEALMTLLNPWSLVLGGGSTAEHDWHHEKCDTSLPPPPLFPAANLPPTGPRSRGCHAAFVCHHPLPPPLPSVPTPHPSRSPH